MHSWQIHRLESFYPLLRAGHIDFKISANFMKHIHPSHKFAEIDWQALGELEVRSDSDLERLIQAWLIKTLHPLALHPNLLDRILRSACEAAARALQFNEASMRFRHIHMLAFAPCSNHVTGLAWGFFRIEKLKGTADAAPHDHSIEFYLYLEGQ